MRTNTGIGEIVTLQIPMGFEPSYPKSLNNRGAEVIATYGGDPRFGVKMIVNEVLIMEPADLCLVATQGFREWVPRTWCKFSA
jgi:hypothetical protein